MHRVGAFEVRSRKRAPGCYRRPVAAGLLLVGALLAAQARAQVYEPRGQGLVAGRFVIYPSILLDYSRSDNIFHQSTDLPREEIIASGASVVRPRLLVDLPLGPSRIRWLYSPLYRDYTSKSFRQSDRVSHYFDLEAVWQSARALRIEVRDHLVRGTVELQEVDPGGELTFGLVPFQVHEPEMTITQRFGARQGISVIPRFGTTRFDEKGEAAFFSSRQRGLEGRYNLDLTPATRLYGFYGSDITDQDRNQVLFRDVRSTTRSAGIGLRRTANQRVVTSASLGYESAEFTGGADEDFSGPVMDLSINGLMSDVLGLSVALRRQPYPSYFVNNNYYVNETGRVQFTHQIGRRVYYTVAMIASGNVYSEPLDIAVTPETPPGLDGNGNGLVDDFESLVPSLGRRRIDRLRRAEVGAGFQFHPSVRLIVGYNLERRRSNMDQLSRGAIIDPFGYDINVVFFRIEAGWL